jgi:hypothetical protein
MVKQETGEIETGETGGRNRERNRGHPLDHHLIESD